MRMPIKADEKLAVTLRFLATEESFESLQYQFRINKSTICKFVPCVCEAIYKTLKGEYFNFPASQEEWLDLAKDAEERWQFPNSFADADGKHISIYHPHCSGATFYNYKGFYSIVLLAFVDYNYRYIFADVGLGLLDVGYPRKD
ncbi:uncharacterized protein LOC135694802 [Rhopilema esculentum]|uniref:uncharacterized protein LOC135694802 n=1 Tax=Rhopilema esculentum TaxID=499914 RepID=UPI0031DC026C